jgi:cyclophilin family peptidyl-prolyl cis-trans isomerase
MLGISMKNYLCITLLIFAIVSAAHVNAQDTSSPRVLLETTKGNIVLELDPEKAPKTVENFLTYVREGYYDGTIFHRVIKGFMIQGGGLTDNMQPKPTHPPVVNEADNLLKNRVGTIAMARTMSPHSATSQFFINVNDNHFLDHTANNPQGWGYCVFGKVIEGLNVVRIIENEKTTSRAGHSDVPEIPVVITSVKILSSILPSRKGLQN